MADTKFTQGEWKAEIDSEGGLWVRILGHDQFIGDMEVTCGECHANADLIAAAPDLYAALGLMVENTSDYTQKLAGARKLADAALAKARGEQ